MNTQTTRNDIINEVKQNFEYFIEMQNNDSGISLDGIGDIANILFNLKDDSMQLRLALHSRGLRTTSDDDSTEDDITRDTRFTLQRCEIIDKDHIEVKLIRDMNMNNSKTRDAYHYHDIMTVKDSKIVMIEPYVQFNNITDETRSDSTDSSSLSSSLLSQWSDR